MHIVSVLPQLYSYIVEQLIDRCGIIIF